MIMNFNPDWYDMLVLNLYYAGYKLKRSYEHNDQNIRRTYLFIDDTTVVIDDFDFESVICYIEGHRDEGFVHESSLFVTLSICLKNLVEKYNGNRNT